MIPRARSGAEHTAVFLSRERVGQGLHAFLFSGEAEVLRPIAVVMMAAGSLAACDEAATAPQDGSTFVIQVVDEQFRVRIDDPVVAGQARALIASGQQKNLNGEIDRGHAGINTGYSWHLKPHTIEFVDVTIELCDGMPSFVEQNVDYFVDTVQRYCPWGVQVLSEATPQ